MFVMSFSNGSDLYLLKLFSGSIARSVLLVVLLFGNSCFLEMKGGQGGNDFNLSAPTDSLEKQSCFFVVTEPAGFDDGIYPANFQQLFDLWRYVFSETVVWQLVIAGFLFFPWWPSSFSRPPPFLFRKISEFFPKSHPRRSQAFFEPDVAPIFRLLS